MRRRGKEEGLGLSGENSLSLLSPGGGKETFHSFPASRCLSSALWAEKGLRLTGLGVAGTHAPQKGQVSLTVRLAWGLGPGACFLVESFLVSFLQKTM